MGCDLFEAGFFSVGQFLEKERRREQEMTAEVEGCVREYSKQLEE